MRDNPNARDERQVELARVKRQARWRSRLTCRIFGHDDLCSAIDPWDTECRRCGFTWEYGEYVRSDLNWSLRLNWLRSWIRVLDPHWWRACKTCRRRFYRCECMPF